MPTAPSRARDTATTHAAEDEIRDHEVLRANRELAAYFRGHRTEREARAALKIIKAFIRDRERVEPGKRRPLPGAAKVTKSVRKPHKGAARRKARTRRGPAVNEPVAPLATEPAEGVDAE